MVKNKLEKKFSESLKAHEVFWGMKLHNNPLAHQNTPADYIISFLANRRGNDLIKKLHLLLVECKQVTCKDGKGRLAHKRLKQMHDLLAFESKFHYHYSYFCIAFYDKRWDKSDVYIIPAGIMKFEMIKEPKVSFNREDMRTIFCEFKIRIYAGLLDLYKLIE